MTPKELIELQTKVATGNLLKARISELKSIIDKLNSRNFMFEDLLGGFFREFKIPSLVDVSRQMWEKKHFTGELAKFEKEFAAL